MALSVMHKVCVAQEHRNIPEGAKFSVSSQSAFSAAAAVVHRPSCAFGWQRSQHQAAARQKLGLSETKYCLTKGMRPAVKISAH